MNTEKYSNYTFKYCFLYTIVILKMYGVYIPIFIICFSYYCEFEAVFFANLVIILRIFLCISVINGIFFFKCNDSFHVLLCITWNNFVQTYICCNTTAMIPWIFIILTNVCISIYFGDITTILIKPIVFNGTLQPFSSLA